MSTALTVLVAVAVVVLLALALSVRIVKQYEQGVLFRFGRVVGVRQPGLRVIIPLVDVLHRVSMRIVTMPIQSQGIITRDNAAMTSPRRWTPSLNSLARRARRAWPSASPSTTGGGPRRSRPRWISGVRMLHRWRSGHSARARTRSGRARTRSGRGRRSWSCSPPTRSRSHGWPLISLP